MIDKTFIINLARRPDKKKHMENEFNKLKNNNIDLHQEFFEAIDGNDPNVLSQYNFNIPNWFDPNSGKAMTNGEVGCALSHYGVWKKIISAVDNEELPKKCNVLILEDDVVFMDDFQNKLINYINEVPNLEYDMIYVHRKPLNLEGETKLSPHINTIKKSYWNCAYILTYDGAKKLVNANYLDNLIPVDEFIPAMYGCNIFGFEKLYHNRGGLKCYAVCPSLLKLTGNAFMDSETFHSNAYGNNSSFKFGTDKEFLMLYIGVRNNSIPTESYLRFENHCKLYGIPLYSINTNTSQDNIHVLQSELKSWSAEKLTNTLLTVVLNNGEYDILPASSPTEIIQKYLDMSSFKIVVSVLELDENMESVLFCSWAHNLLDILNDNDQNSNIKSIRELLTIGTCTTTDIVFDRNFEIFQPLDKNHQDIRFNHKTSRILNNSTKTTSPIAYSKDFRGRLLLNKMENYTGNGWNEYYGCRIPTKEVNPLPHRDKSDSGHLVLREQDPCSLGGKASDKPNLVSGGAGYAGSFDSKHYQPGLDLPHRDKSDSGYQPGLDLPKIYLSFKINHDRSALKFLNIIEYPRDRLVVNINESNDSDIYHKDILNFLKTDCDYYFFINEDCILTNPLVLKELLSFDKNVIAPFIRRGTETWTNFWGDLDDGGYYKRSFDYIDIINGSRRGCWNVPYIMGTYLIKRDILKILPDLFLLNKHMDSDMQMCHNFREHNIFMYVTNMNNYGYIAVISPQETHNIVTLPQKIPGEITLYDIFDDKQKWEEKYLHPIYYQHKNNLSTLPYVELCNDIYNFPLFSQQFCTEIIQRSESYGKWSKGKDEHNDPRLGAGYYENVPTVDIQLFELQLEKQWKEIVFSYIAPFVKVLYNNYKTKDINLAFVVRYKFDDQRSLEPHHDSSTYTVNIALNRGNGIDYEGGGCKFIRQNYILRNQDPGMCCIHAGRLTAYHEGLCVDAGTRYILVSFIN